MSGYMFCLGACINCHTPISFHPDKVPSVRYPPPDGPKEPLCANCAAELNEILASKGKQRVPIHPDAYLAEPLDCYEALE